MNSYRVREDSRNCFRERVEQNHHRACRRRDDLSGATRERAVVAAHGLRHRQGNPGGGPMTSAVGTTVPNVIPIIIASAHRTMLGAKSENRLRVFELQAKELFGCVRKNTADRSEVVDALQAMAEESGLIDLYGQDHVQAMMVAAAEDNSADADTSDAPREEKTGNWRADLIDAHHLYDQQFPDLRYVVEGLFPEGVTLLASRPKLGKSWLMLQIGHAVAKGVSTLVASDKPICGDVLYLALEDSPRRLKRRLQKFCGTDKRAWPQRLKLVTKWRRLDQGGLDDIREWCRSAENPTLLLVDVLKRVRGARTRQQSDYDADYESCRGLQEVAAEFGLAIIVAHHDRKMDAEDPFDTVSGTLGLTGGVDAIAVMKRKAGTVALYIEGRDLPDDVEKAIRFDRETCRWTILGDATEVQRSNERQRVVSALATAPDGMSVAEITTAASMVTRGATDKLLFHMLRDGDVTRVRRGIYSLPSNPKD
jgi:AAA domain